MSTQRQQFQTDAQFPTNSITDAPVDVVCPTDGTILSDADRLKDTDRYECPACGAVRTEEVLRR